MATHDWSRFAIRINVNAPVEKLYRAWSTRQGIEHWFLRMGEFTNASGKLRADDELVEKGDSYKWLWHGYNDDAVERGTVLEINGKDLFKFTFGKAGDCTVRIFKEHDETIVELTQDNIPTDEAGMEHFHVGCKTGWTFYLANLKSLYEGGIDLRNKNVQLKSMMNS